ncbi:MAG: succinyl-diaminopimelate desuccinylase [Salinisphaera sp.]|jgi:succinyl-diaminopimelate desuccinylase|nr:succinyl-diaminopimelate desuccinylase [Salinisphaera sp.]
MTNADSALNLAQALISRESVTPDDAGCQPLIAERLAAAGFVIEHMRIGEVDNLWAVAGNDGPLLCLAGHTDVVPPGPIEDWRTPPFDPTVIDGYLYGRGAADMKSSVAAMVCAAERFRVAYPNHTGRLAFLLTSDEEGSARDGTRAVMQALGARGIHIDYCLVGEPSSKSQLADTVKNGRRGSLNAHIRVRGRQGHVAYPQHADNAVHRLLPLLNELATHGWDGGDEAFPPTSFQISSIRAGTGAENVIPGVAEACVNWRFSPLQTHASIKTYVEERCRAHAIDPATIMWRLSGEPFITRKGRIVDAAIQAINEKTGQLPVLSTAGGTSDGRFIAPTGTQVLELGPCNDTIHQANERVLVADIDQLSEIYEEIIRRTLISL